MTSTAVIGAGIGGCASAYFIHKYLPNTKVTIYDSQQRTGGRIHTQKAYNTNLELGAAFFNQGNRTILKLVDELKLNFQPVEEYADFLIWDGTKIIFRSNKNMTINYFKIFSKYKSAILKTLSLLNKAKKHLAQFYLQAQEKPNEIDSLFDAAGLKEYCNTTFEEILTETGISQTFIDDIATPITRTIYNQNADLGGFAGLASLIGVYGYPIYRFTQGNSTFPNSLIEKSNATIQLNKQVASIEKTSKNKYDVTTGKDQESFDHVIIATPLGLADIEFNGITVLDSEQQYQQVYTQIIRGVLDPTYFGLETASEAPAIVLTTKDADPIRHCSIQKIENDESIVTLTSTEPIPDNKFRELFKNNCTPVLEHKWEAAYPKFKPITKLPQTQLDKGIFYVNAVEPAISSMETTALSALNCIRILNGNLPST